jgi:catechol 2,3-dioxygenase-like lactoylglutathione lyase family enzyme
MRGTVAAFGLSSPKERALLEGRDANGRETGGCGMGEHETGEPMTPERRGGAADIPRQRVTGIGGVFWKAREPATLTSWYVERLGVPLDPTGTLVLRWLDLEGGAASTVVAPFPAATTYFAPSTAPFMLNFRVADLDAMLTQLRSEGCEVVDGIEEMEFGRFGWVVDPEGNKIELWEPAPGV